MERSYACGGALLLLAVMAAAALRVEVMAPRWWFVGVAVGLAVAGVWMVTRKGDGGDEDEIESA